MNSSEIFPDNLVKQPDHRKKGVFVKKKEKEKYKLAES